MKTLKALSILLLLLFSISCANQKETSNAVAVKSEIDNYLTKAMELHNIPGLALAVINADKIVYESYFGKASLEENTVVNENTIFRVFSTSKLITTTGIFQLIDKGQLQLEDSLAKYLDDLPAQWQSIKIKNLLSHSSGIPNFIRYKSTLSDEELMEKLSNDKMEFVTGNQFSYNQTNYWLLAQIIEKITGTTFDKYILQHQFDNSTNGVLFSSNAQENIPNRATRYHYSGRTEAFEKDTRNDGTRGHPGNGLNITLSKFIEWDKQLKSNQLLSKSVKSQMWSPFNYTNNFTYQKDHFLHGWGYYPVNHLDSYGFSGGNLSAYRYFPESNTTIILLSNAYQTPGYDIIINDIARIVLPALRDKELTQEEDVLNFVLNNQLDKAKQGLKKLEEENPNAQFENLKSNMNGIGNTYTWNDELQKALEIFKLSAEAYPNWWIAFAGLAETYESQKDTLNALKNYQQAILLNEKNEYNYNEPMKNAIRELKK